MVAELDVLSVDTGADAPGHGFRTGECRPDRRKGRSLLGGAVLSGVRYARFDHAQTNCWSAAGDLWLIAVFGAVFY